MDQLINQEFFQFVLNQFLAIDKDLIPWKLTSSYCYNYPHYIHIKYSDVKKYNNLIKNTKISEIDTSLYLQKSEIYFYRQCDCGLTKHIRTSFDIDFLDQELPHLKKLTLSYMNHQSDLKMGSILSKLNNLEYLDLGINTYVPNYTFKNLNKLKTLYLRNNCNTAEIFQFLPNLETVQIGYEIESNLFYIKLKHIPAYITKIIQNGYSYNCPMKGWYARDGCEPLYQHEEYSIMIRAEKK